MYGLKKLLESDCRHLLSHLTLIHIPLYLLWLDILGIRLDSKFSRVTNFYYILIIIVIFTIIFFIRNIIFIKKRTLCNPIDSGKRIFLLKFLLSIVIFFILLFSLNSFIINFNNDINEMSIKKISISYINNNNFGGIAFDCRAIEIDLGKVFYSPFIKTVLMGRNNYVLVYFKRIGKRLSQQLLSPDFIPEPVKYIIKVPETALNSGYDTLRIYSLSGEGTYRLNSIEISDENPSFVTEGELNKLYDVRSELAFIIINIEEKELEKIQNQIEQVTEKGVFLPSPFDSVPVKLEYKGKNYNAFMRLEEGTPYNISFKGQWSYKIKMSHNNKLDGMKEFTISSPYLKNYLNRWLYYKILDKKGIICPACRLINVVINDKNSGIYMLESSLNEDFIFDNSSRGVVINLKEEEELKSNIEKNVKNPKIYKNLKKITELIGDFERNNLKLSQIFDIDKLSFFYSISDFMGVTSHTTYFYYNEETSLLEPVPDGRETVKENTATYLQSDSTEFDHIYKNKFFNNPDFLRKYIYYLEIFSKEDYIENIFFAFKDKMNLNINILRLAQPDYNFSKESLYKNYRIAKIWLNPVKCLHAYFNKNTEKKILLTVGNLLPVPLEIISLTWGEKELRPLKEVILPARNKNDYPYYQEISFVVPEDRTVFDRVNLNLNIKYKIPGSGRTMSDQVYPWPYLSSDFTDKDFIRKKPDFEKFEFISVDKNEKRIDIKTGKHKITKNIIIPSGYRVFCGEGTELDLINSSKILTYSPLEFTGSDCNPVFINSTDGTGQGIVVLNAEGLSILKNVIFDNLASPDENGWKLTGAVTFYESPVEISRCQFKNNSSEDGLNIIRSKYRMDECLFENTFSDGFDCDFTEGTIKNTSFINTGNDGLDISGSKLSVEGIKVKGCGDKGLSIGENSKATGNDIKIYDAKVGLASKDMSVITVSNVEIMKAQIGFAVYQKKKEYGPASIIATGIKLNKQMISMTYLIENKSTITVDGIPVISRRKEKEKLLLKKIKLGEML